MNFSERRKSYELFSYMEAALLSFLFPLFIFAPLHVKAGMNDELDKFDFHGFISQGYLNSSANNIYGKTKKGSFEFGEYGLNFSSELSDNLWVGTQLFARDLGVIGNNQVKIDWAVADYRSSDVFGFRFGKIKLPLGLYNSTRDADTARTFIFLPTSVYSELNREFTTSIIGGSIYGDLNDAPGGDLSYEFLCGTLSIDNDHLFVQDLFTVAATAVGINSFQSEFNDPQYAIAGRLQWSPELIENLRLEVSGLKSEIDSGFDFVNLIPGGGLGKYRASSNISINVASLEYTYKAFTFASEFFRYHSDTNIHIKSTAASSFIDLARASVSSDGYYFSGEYEFSDMIRVGSYYSVAYPDRQNRNRTHRDYLKDITLTARVDFNDYLTWKIEGHRMKGTAQLTATNNPDNFKPGWYLLTSKITVSF
ncbi:Uncharacterized protein SCG7109_AB_00180 [Chlamydiales bacterium SCGC AG-110-M15]|nr:Uncharacterized protein SCG7109_AB_00180 [Chlamydiales bacterium SCGC AG-110-M15]